MTPRHIPIDCLPIGAKIDFYGERFVVDVHNLPTPEKVRLVTTRGEFEIDRYMKLEVLE